MNKFISRFTKDDLGTFTVLTALFIFTFIWSWGWRRSLFFGIVFGLSVMFLFGWIRSKKKSRQREELIVLSTPRFISYLLTVFFHLLGFALALAYWSEFDDRASLLLPAICYLSLCAGSIYSLGIQFIIGKSFLVIRRSFLGFKRERILLWKDAVSVSTGMLGATKIKFQDGQKITLHCYELENLASLPECKSPSILKSRDLICRLKEEIERYIKNASPSDTKSESTSIKAVAFNAIGLKGFALTGIFVYISLLGLAYQNHLQLVEKIKQTGDQQSLRYETIHDAFWLFKGNEFTELKKSWDIGCSKNRDYNCRLASYLLTSQGKATEALEVLNMSCSTKDPHSCFNVFDHPQASDMDKKNASALLDEVCQTDTFKNQTCCTCYAESKDRVRKPAQQ